MAFCRFGATWAWARRSMFGFAELLRKSLDSTGKTYHIANMCSLMNVSIIPKRSVKTMLVFDVWQYVSGHFSTVEEYIPPCSKHVSNLFPSCSFHVPNFSQEFISDVLQLLGRQEPNDPTAKASVQLLGPAATLLLEAEKIGTVLVDKSKLVNV